MEHVWWGICLVNGASLVGDMFGEMEHVWWGICLVNGACLVGDMFGKWSIFGGGYVW